MPEGFSGLHLQVVQLQTPSVLEKELVLVSHSEVFLGLRYPTVSLLLKELVGQQIRVANLSLLEVNDAHHLCAHRERSSLRRPQVFLLRLVAEQLFFDV